MSFQKLLIYSHSKSMANGLTIRHGHRTEDLGCANVCHGMANLPGRCEKAPRFLESQIVLLVTQEAASCGSCSR